MWFFRNLIKLPLLFQQSLCFSVKRNSSKHVPSLYSCNSVSSAPGSIFQHQLVKQFQISTPTLAYSYSYPPTPTPSKPSLHPSIPPSVLPLIPFHSGTIRSLSQSQPWPGAQSGAWPAWTQLWTLNLSLSALPSLVCWLPLYPDSISAYFRRALVKGLHMQWMLLCTVYRARLNTLRVSSRAQQ